MTSEETNLRLAERIVACLRGVQGSPHPAAVDLSHRRILIIGSGPSDTHVSQAEIEAHPDQYCPIPSRERIESRDHIVAFLQDYRPLERRLLDQARAAFGEHATVVQWRQTLGEDHEAVQAFDAYMDPYHHVIARMLMHGRKRRPFYAPGDPPEARHDPCAPITAHRQA